MKCVLGWCVVLLVWQQARWRRLPPAKKTTTKKAATGTVSAADVQE